VRPAEVGRDDRDEGRTGARRRLNTCSHLHEVGGVEISSVYGRSGDGSKKKKKKQRKKKKKKTPPTPPPSQGFLPPCLLPFQKKKKVYPPDPEHHVYRLLRSIFSEASADCIIGQRPVSV